MRALEVFEEPKKTPNAVRRQRVQLAPEHWPFIGKGDVVAAIERGIFFRVVEKRTGLPGEGFSVILSPMSRGQLMLADDDRLQVVLSTAPERAVGEQRSVAEKELRHSRRIV